MSLLSSNYNIYLTDEDLKTLDKGKSVNDQVINFFFQILQEEETNIMVLPTFFYPKLKAKGWSSVLKWLKITPAIFRQDYKILLPIHNKNHWTLVSVSTLLHRIHYYDSLNQTNPSAILNPIKEFMNALEKTFSLETPRKWVIVYHTDTPQQQTPTQCGVYVCQFAQHISKNLPIRDIARKPADIMKLDIQINILRKC